jgi:mono/diheme cytochrome c family protein
MMRWRSKPGYVAGAAAMAVLVLVSLGAVTHESGRSAASRGATAADTIARGRYVVLTADCSGCHGGNDNPANDGWLAGETTPDMQFLIGPCYLTPGAKPCWHTHPRNLTPDNETGLGRFTERQIFNALRYGLRPEDTPDVEITSLTPGQGNFPLHPHYLAYPMPWFAWRHMPDADLWAIAAYLKRGLKPVHNKVPESEGPPDFWASWYEDVIKIGGYPVAPFPTKNEVGGQ